MDEFFTTRRFHVVLLSLFAGAGVLLAAIGIYGLVRQDVSQRTQEIGVRVTLGASRRNVASLVLRRCLVLTAVGIAVGWLGVAGDRRHHGKPGVRRLATRSSYVPGGADYPLGYRITVIASKDGYLSSSRTVPLSPPDRVPPPMEGERWETYFHLEPLGSFVDVAGVYTMTLTADRTCTNLPDEARTRAYTATIVPAIPAPGPPFVQR